MCEVANEYPKIAFGYTEDSGNISVPVGLEPNDLVFYKNYQDDVPVVISHDGLESKEAARRFINKHRASVV
jgi:hypothetical protein